MKDSNSKYYLHGMAKIFVSWSLMCIYSQLSTSNKNFLSTFRRV